MGRKPCCSKVGLNKGAWTPAEDKILTDYIKQHGEGGWRNLPKLAGLKRCGKSCRLRWLNYLRPDIKRGNITPDEEELIVRLHKLLGNRWSLIAGRLPGRTDNEIKNYWNTYLCKRVNDHHPKPPAPKRNRPKTTNPPKEKPNKQKKRKKKDSGSDKVPENTNITPVIRTKALRFSWASANQQQKQAEEVKENSVSGTNEHVRSSKQTENEMNVFEGLSSSTNVISSELMGLSELDNNRIDNAFDLPFCWDEILFDWAKGNLAEQEVEFGGDSSYLTKSTLLDSYQVDLFS